MVDTPKRTSWPLIGWRQSVSASSRSAVISAPGAGGAASSGPTTAKRRCAQRCWRLPAVSSSFIGVAPFADTVSPPTTAHAAGIFCGSLFPVTKCQSPTHTNPW